MKRAPPVAGRTADAPARWLEARDPTWRARIQWAVMDLSGPYRATFDTMLPHAVQVADPFHVVKLAGAKLDECRRRVQNETLGHHGQKHDPLYRCRRLLLAAEERLDRKGNAKLQGLLRAGEPKGEVAYASHAKEAVRFLYDIPNPEMAGRYLDELARDLQDETFPPEVREPTRHGHSPLKSEEPVIRCDEMRGTIRAVPDVRVVSGVDTGMGGRRATQWFDGSW